MLGWIKLYRQIQECFIWSNDEPFDRRSAWVDLLLLVNHEDKSVIFNGKFISVKRGQRITSVRKLSERWGWSTKKTTSFLNLLESENMITKESDNKKTLLTIVNYELYQDCGNTEETQKKRTGNTEETQKKRRLPTNKNDKNDKNDKNEKNEKNILLSESAQKIIDLYNLQCPSLPKVTKLTDGRVRSVTARLKEYTEEEIEMAFVKAENSDFLRKGSGSWKGASFDWLMNSNNIVKVLEGNYDNQKETKDTRYDAILDFMEGEANGQ